MAVKRSKPDPDGITTARLAGTAGRHASRHPLDVEAAVAELREIAHGRGDLLAEQAGLTLSHRERDERDGLWPGKVLEAAPTADNEVPALRTFGPIAAQPGRTC